MGTCLNNPSAEMKNSASSIILEVLMFLRSAHTAHLYLLTALSALCFSMLDLLYLFRCLHGDHPVGSASCLPPFIHHRFCWGPFTLLRVSVEFSLVLRSVFFLSLLCYMLGVEQSLEHSRPVL